MHRFVVQPFLKQSTRFSTPQISSVSFRGGTTQSTSPSSIKKISSLIITRSSSTASSSFDDYDQIMRTTTQSASSSSFSSSAGGNTTVPLPLLVPLRTQRHIIRRHQHHLTMMILRHRPRHKRTIDLLMIMNQRYMKIMIHMNYTILRVRRRRNRIMMLALG